MNHSKSPTTTQTESRPTAALGRWQRAAFLIGDPYDVAEWVTALRESNDWRGLICAVAFDARAKEAALIASVRLSDEAECEARK